MQDKYAGILKLLESDSLESSQHGISRADPSKQNSCKPLFYGIYLNVRLGFEPPVTGSVG